MNIRKMAAMLSLSALPLLFIFISSCSIPDFYSNYAELSANEVEGIDYQVTHSSRNSPITVLAIHGGGIEMLTSELSIALAQDQLNLYLFEGIKFKDNMRLHLTSSHFDEPRALDLVQSSETCLSFHGYKHESATDLCVGGLNERLSTTIIDSLQNSWKDSAVPVPFQITYPCSLYPGTEPLNIVNRCLKNGVQLELSSPLRKLLKEDPKFFEKFIEGIRKGIKSYQARSFK